MAALSPALIFSAATEATKATEAQGLALCPSEFRSMRRRSRRDSSEGPSDIPSRQKETTMPRVSLNQLAPEFSLPDLSGSPVSLSDYRGRKNVLLVFNRGFT